MRKHRPRRSRRETAPVNWARVTVVELTGDKWLMGTFTFAILGLLVGQRGIAGISRGRFRPAIDAILCVLSGLMACWMFVSLVILGLIIPHGAALLGAAMLLLVAYMTTWDKRHMAFPMIAVRANISKIKFWKYS
jgi:hypothetical protein